MSRRMIKPFLEYDLADFSNTNKEQKSLAEIRRDAYTEGFMRGKAEGRAEYEAECEKLFNENPPMHFTKEQIMWIKERMKMSRQQGGVDAINLFLDSIKSYDIFNYSPHDVFRLLRGEEKDYMPYIHYDDVIKCAKAVKEQKNEDTDK